MSIPCRQCARDLGPNERRRAFLSVFAQGDEETRSWFFCEDCRNWTVQDLYDHFLGDTSVRTHGPYPEGSCEADVALANTCPTPGDKWCDCPAHKKLAP